MPTKDPAAALLSTLSTEASLVETPAIELMATLGWSTANLLQETLGPANPTGRLSLKSPFLPARLSAALHKINPTLPQDTIQQAIVNRHAKGTPYRRPKRTPRDDRADDRHDVSMFG